MTMRYGVILFILLAVSMKSYSQNERDFNGHLVVFLVTGFNGDSIRVMVNKDTLLSERIKSSPHGDFYDGNFFVGLADTAQTLAIFDIKRNTSVESKIKPEFQYLYIFRLGEKDFNFDYSNDLRLPE